MGRTTDKPVPRYEGDAMRRTMIATLSIALVVLSVPASGAAAASAGTSCPAVAHHIDAQHSGFSCSTLPTTLAKKWSITLNGDASYPLVAGGRVFVTTSNSGGPYGGWLYALNASDGTVAWGPVPLSGTYYYFPLAYDGGRVFVNDFDGTIRAFDAGTGAQAWTTPTAYFSGEPVALNGRVWVQGPGIVYGLSETTGQIVAQSPYLDGDGAAPAADQTGVYVSTGCASQYALNLDGTLKWSDHDGCTGGGGASTALRKRLMFGADGDVVLQKTNGTQVGSFAGWPAFAGPDGFFAVDDSVFAEDVQTTVPLWTTPVGGTILAGPVATRSAVFVATDADQLVTLDPRTGHVLSTIALAGTPGGGGQYFGSPSDMAVGGSLLVIPTGSTVTAYG
jgi:outer membrane protein assembly factor BamB